MTVKLVYIASSANCPKVAIISFPTAMQLLSAYAGPAKLGGPGWPCPPPLFCQAKLNMALDFKISTEVSDFEIMHSMY